MLVSGLFVLIFAILGINFYKGTFFYCDIPAELEDSLTLILDKVDCLNYGGMWLNSRSNFDNIFNAMQCLFEMMTTEGWLIVMYSGVDAVGIDFQPKRDNSLFQLIFFIGFIIVGNMFIFNLFVGVVIDNFNRMKD